MVLRQMGGRERAQISAGDLAQPAPALSGSLPRHLGLGRDERAPELAGRAGGDRDAIPTDPILAGDARPVAPGPGPLAEAPRTGNSGPVLAKPTPVNQDRRAGRRALVLACVILPLLLYVGLYRVNQGYTELTACPSPPPFALTFEPLEFHLYDLSLNVPDLLDAAGDAAGALLARGREFLAMLADRFRGQTVEPARSRTSH